MNIRQIKRDIDNGVFVSKETWGKVLDAALIQQVALMKIEASDIGDNGVFSIAYQANNKVAEL